MFYYFEVFLCLLVISCWNSKLLEMVHFKQSKPNWFPLNVCHVCSLFTENFQNTTVCWSAFMNWRKTEQLQFELRNVNRRYEKQKTQLLQGFAAAPFSFLCVFYPKNPVRMWLRPPLSCLKLKYTVLLLIRRNSILPGLFEKHLVLAHRKEGRNQQAVRSHRPVNVNHCIGLTGIHLYSDSLTVLPQYKSTLLIAGVPSFILALSASS